MKFKSGDMVVIVWCGPACQALVGRIVTLTTVCPVYGKDYWDSDPPLFIAPFPRPVSLKEETLRLIKDGDLTLDETSDLTLPAQPETTSTPC